MTRSEILATIQCTVIIKLIMALWQHITTFNWSQNNCVDHSFLPMCQKNGSKLLKRCNPSKTAQKDTKRAKMWCNEFGNLIFNLHFLQLFVGNAYFLKHFWFSQDVSFPGVVLFKINWGTIPSVFANMFRHWQCNWKP